MPRRRRYDGDGALLRLGLQAHALGIAWEFDPYFGLSVSRVDPLPHQLEAVYDHLLKLARVRFLLADDAGAGKTIMAGLLIRELQLRGLAERILIVAPSNLAFQWQRELQEKFDETFVVLKGSELRALSVQARDVERAGVEAKLAKLEALLRSQGFFDQPEQRLVLFSEFKDTLDYLVERLAAWGFQVATIHGGMKPGSREEPGTRLHAEQQFREGAAQVLVATEAAGEGINLQVCNILFNYDIPWNPNRLEQRMGRIHRYGQEKDCLIFNFVATHTIEGRVLERLLGRLEEIRDALDDDAVFNVVGEVLPAARVERVLRDYYAGRLGNEDLENRLLRDVDEGRFRNICRNALEGLATKKLNLEMLVERRARARERRVVPETIARFLRDAAPLAPLQLDFVGGLAHTFEPGRTPASLRRYERERDWKLPELAMRYPRCSTDRDTARKHALEWVTPGHPLFEAVRRHARDRSLDPLARGATFHSLAHDAPARIDFYRARVVDGLGRVVHERVFAVELAGGDEPRRCEPGVLGDLNPAPVPDALPEIAQRREPASWLREHVLMPFLEDTRAERLAEVERVADHVELSLTELLQRADEEIGRAAGDVDEGRQGAEGRLAMAEARHAELLARRERRREELQQQQALSLQGVERMTSVLVLPHPERGAAEVKRHQPDPETEATAMRVVMGHERDQGRHVEDVSAKNLGYDVTSLDTTSGDLRLIEVKGLAATTGTILLTPNERRVAEDRPDCYWLYVARGTPHLRGRYQHWRAQGAWQSEEQFSDGTLRLMGLLWAAMDKGGPLLLEEPELSLHPEIVRVLPQMLARVQRRGRPR